jgi:hypothetical protein
MEHLPGMVSFIEQMQKSFGEGYFLDFIWFNDLKIPSLAFKYLHADGTYSHGIGHFVIYDKEGKKIATCQIFYKQL